MADEGSMWGGYWERDGSAMREWAEREEIEAHLVHSGGHARPEGLDRLAAAIDAKQNVPVHADASVPRLG
jgi:hypothetical protein